MVDFYATAGLPCPPQTNPADWALDAISTPEGLEKMIVRCLVLGFFRNPKLTLMILLPRLHPTKLMTRLKTRSLTKTSWTQVFNELGEVCFRS